MLQALPIGGYEFVPTKGKDVDWLAGLGKGDEYGYLIEQTGYYPKTEIMISHHYRKI